MLLNRYGNTRKSTPANIGTREEIQATVKLNGYKVSGIIDTGAVLTCVSLDTVKKAGLKLNRVENCNVTLADNTKMAILGTVRFSFSFLGLVRNIKVIVIEKISDNLIIGMDILVKFRVVIDSENGKLYSKINKKTFEVLNHYRKKGLNIAYIEVDGCRKNLNDFKLRELVKVCEPDFESNLEARSSLSSTDPDFLVCLKLANKVTIPGRSNMIVEVNSNYTGLPLILELYGNAGLFYKHLCRIPAAVMSSKDRKVLITNFSDNGVTLSAGQDIAVGVIPQTLQEYLVEGTVVDFKVRKLSPRKSYSIEDTSFDSEVNWFTSCLEHDQYFNKDFSDYPSIFNRRNKKALEIAESLKDGSYEKKKQLITSPLQLNINEDLSSFDRQKFIDFLGGNLNIFNPHPPSFLNQGIEPFNIQTTTEHPVTKPPYRKSPAERSIIDEYVKQMLDDGIIQPSTSQWASPVILVRKKKKGWRLCIDYRQLNDVTVADTFPLPRIDDTLDSLAGARYFSSLDCTDGFHHIPIHPRDRKKTAFITHSGLYEYLVMPFGLRNAPAKFQRVMNQTLRHLTWKQCLVYLDDIIVFGRNIDQLLERLQNVFNSLNDTGFKLNPSKCTFGQTELEYLGHTISEYGIKPSKSKVEIVRNYPEPNNIKELRSFIGLVSYHRQFIPELAKHVSVLTKLLKKNSKFEWKQEHKDAFVYLKSSLCSQPILTFYDSSKKHILATDASGGAIGSILKQEEEFDGKTVLKPVAYWGRGLTRAESRYQATELECLALVESIKRFRPYLQFEHFIVETDHRALLKCQSWKNSNARLTKWSLFFQDYSFEVIYKKGKLHIDADAISRIPNSKNDKMRGILKKTGKLADIRKEKRKKVVTFPMQFFKEDANDDTSFSFSSPIRVDPCPTSFDESSDEFFSLPSFDEKSLHHSTPIKDHSDSTKAIIDDDYSGSTQIYDFSQDSVPEIVISQPSIIALSSPVQVKSCPPSVNRDYEVKKSSCNITSSDQKKDPFLNRKIVLLSKRGLTKEERVEVESFCLHKDLLYKKWEQKGQGIKAKRFLLTVPFHLTKSIIFNCHDSSDAAHHGQFKTLSKIQSRFWWPGLKKEVKLYIQCCTKCQMNKRRYGKRPGLIQPMAEQLNEGHRPFSMMAMDIIVLKDHPSFKKKYIIVACDYVSRYVVADSLINQSSASIANFIMKRIVLSFGAPEIIISDNATNNTSERIRDAMKVLEIKHKLITTYHPEGNGLVERCNGAIKSLLKCLIDINKKDWANWLPYAVFSYNTTKHSITSYTPFYLVHGFEARLSVENEAGRKELFGREKFEETPEQSFAALIEARELAKQRLKSYGKKMKERVDAHRVIADFNVGDKVWLLEPIKQTGTPKSFWIQWKGPFVIMKELGLASYEIVDLVNQDIVYKVHAQRLKRYYSFNDVPDPVLITKEEELTEETSPSHLSIV